MSDDAEVTGAVSAETKQDIGSELITIIQHTAGVTNILTVATVATLALLVEKGIISFAEFANKAEAVTGLLNTEEGAQSTMLQLIMLAIENKSTIIEKAN